MNRRFFLAALSAASLVSLGSIASAENDVVAGINRYLTDMSSVSARFVQENADGSTSTGTFYMQKPGKMRFEYDPPSPAMVIADGEALAVYDRKSNRGPQVYPQSSTPLSLLSRQDIDVTKSRFVRLIETRNDQIFMLMFDPEEPDNGTMLMIFDQNPVKLAGWVVADAAGQESRIVLQDLVTDISLENKLFSISYTNMLIRQGKL